MLGDRANGKTEGSEESSRPFPAVGLGGEPRVSGLPLDAYAQANQLTEAEVWRRLRRGQLVARHDGERLLVYEELPADVDLKDLHRTLAREDEKHGIDPFTGAEAKALPAPPVAAHPAPPSEAPDALRKDAPRGEDTRPGATAAPADDGDLPPLPAGDEPRPGASARPESPHHYLALSGRKTDTPELALLLDHLSLAKEENREILRLTQDSIRKVTELTDTIVEMKDTVIEAKDAQILALEQRLRAAEGEIKALRQHNEDLDTLARAALADAHRPRPPHPAK